MKKFEQFVYNIINQKSKKFLVIVLTALAFFGSLLMFPTKIVLAKMLPGKSDNTYSIYVDTPTGSSMEETKKVTQCITQILQSEDEIKNMALFYGQGIPLDYAGLVKGSSMKRTENVAEISVNLTDKHDREEPSFLMTQRLRPILQERCSNVVPNTTIKLIEQPAGPPTLASLVVEVHGDNIPQSRELATEVGNILAKTDGLVDIDVMTDDIYQKHELIPDIDKIARSGLAIEQVNNILYLAFEGMVIASKNSEEHSEQIPIFLVLSDNTKRLNGNSGDHIRSKLSSLNLMNQRGMMVPLTEVVTVKKVTQCITQILQSEDEIKNMALFYGQGIPLDYAGLVKGSS
ncbi:MAG TPA: efflux RND transporter permease subunit, partial [Campylobacterales bacterium]|nr:efflux RND transporter permease subunit [Campylobacterales bacterium]